MNDETGAPVGSTGWNTIARARAEQLGLQPGDEVVQRHERHSDGGLMLRTFLRAADGVERALPRFRLPKESWVYRLEGNSTGELWLDVLCDECAGGMVDGERFLLTDLPNDLVGPADLVRLGFRVEEQNALMRFGFQIAYDTAR